jgi:hypothetical protein
LNGEHGPVTLRVRSGVEALAEDTVVGRSGVVGDGVALTVSVVGV